MLNLLKIVLATVLLSTGAWPRIVPEQDRVAAPDWSLRDAQDNIVRLADFRGRILLLNFWATWCAPSTVEMPWFNDFARQYGSRGLSVVGVAVEDYGWDVVRAFARANNIQFPIVLGDDRTVDSHGVSVLPTTFLIDRQGRIAARFVGLVARAEVEDDLQALLPPAPSGRPKVKAVVNAASFRPGVSSLSWITISGENLAPFSRTWTAADFVAGKLPTELDGVRVTVNGKAAFPSFISPTQINALTPEDRSAGPVQVVVSHSGGAGDPAIVNLQPYLPAFFALPNESGKYVAAHAGDMFIGPEGLVTGLKTRPARGGEVITLYGTGFGPASVPWDLLLPAPVALPAPVRITIGFVPAEVRYAGMVSGGLCQFNVVVPPLPAGLYAVIAEVGGVQSPAGPNLVVGY